MNKNMLTTTEAAEYIGTTPGNVRNLFYSGVLKGKREVDKRSATGTYILIEKKSAEKYKKSIPLVGRKRLGFFKKFGEKK